MIPHPIVIATALVALALLPKGRQNYPVGAVYASNCPMTKEKYPLGVVFDLPEFSTSYKYAARSSITLGCTEFSPQTELRNAISSYILLPDYHITCRFYSGLKCDGDVLWEATDRSDAWVTGGDDQTNSVYCFRFEFRDGDGSCELVPAAVGIVYADPMFQGEGQTLERNCTTFREGVAGKVSSYLLFPNEPPCDFYRSSDCTFGRMYDPGGEWRNVGNSRLTGKESDDQAYSAWCQ